MRTKKVLLSFVILLVIVFLAGCVAVAPPRPRPGRCWVPGRWEGRVWIEGRWAP